MPHTTRHTPQSGDTPYPDRTTTAATKPMSSTRSRDLSFVLAVLLVVVAPGAASGQSDALNVVESGYVGIGTETPTSKLHVVGDGSAVTLHVEEGGAVAPRELLRLDNNGQSFVIMNNLAEPERWSFGTFANRFIMNNQASPGIELQIGNTGNLTINGSLTTATQTYPDYVLQPGYSLRTLDELRLFIEQERHLPGVPTAAEVAQQGGVNMSELQMILLEKIEELTLYTLEQQAYIERLEARLEALEGTGSDRQSQPKGAAAPGPLSP